MKKKVFIALCLVIVSVGSLFASATESQKPLKISVSPQAMIVEDKSDDLRLELGASAQWQLKGKTVEDRAAGVTTKLHLCNFLSAQNDLFFRHPTQLFKTSADKEELREITYETSLLLDFDVFKDTFGVAFGAGFRLPFANKGTTNYINGQEIDGLSRILINATVFYKAGVDVKLGNLVLLGELNAPALSTIEADTANRWDTFIPNVKQCWANIGARWLFD